MTGNKQSGRSLLKAILLIPVLLIGIALAYFFFCEARKAYWDHQVKLMCEKDGGNTIYEQVIVTAADFQKWGGEILGIPHESDQRLDIPFFRRTKSQILHTSNPEVARLETIIIRRSDGKFLGKSIYHFRRGGDFPSWAHDSSFGCTKSTLPIEKAVFVLTKE